MNDGLHEATEGAPTRGELVGLLVEAHNALGDCICEVGVSNRTEKLLARIREVLDREDSVYEA